MQVYVDNIIIAAITFPLLALLITVPYMIHQYRKFGSIPWWRTIIVYAFVFYLLCAYYLVILPLPESRTAVVPYAQHPQPIPFNFLVEFFTDSGFAFTDPGTWIPALLTPNLYEAVFNVLMLVPLGMFLRYYFRRTWWQTLLIGFATTLFFEVSQLSGLFGIYAHPYRLFDVDDLILNTFGAMVGFWIMGPAKKALPNMTVINQEAREQGVRVSLTRRVLSFMIDAAIAQAVLGIAAVIGVLFGIELPDLRLGAGNMVLLGLFQLIPWMVFFVLVPSVMGGQTFGQRILKLAIVRADATKASWYQILARYTVLFLFAYAPPFAIDRLMGLEPNGATELSSVADALYRSSPWAIILWAVVVAVWLIALPVRNRQAKEKGRLLVFLFELISGTRIMTVEGVQSLRDRTIVLDVAEVAALEYMIAKDGLPLADLMERAGKSVSAAIQERNPDPTGVLILCGSGNNGGDGWVVAHDLATKDYPVTVVSPMLPTELDADPAKAAAMEAFADAEKDGIPLRIVVKPSEEIFKRNLDQAEVVVDAMLGTGFSGKTVREPYAAWIDAVNDYRKHHAGTYVISIDVPSGYSAQTGKHALPCIEADATITMLTYKPGLLTADAERYCGEISLSRLTDVSPYLDRFISNGQKAASPGRRL